MKDKTDNKAHDDFSLENIKSRIRAKAETNPALFTLTGSTITSAKPIDMNKQNISDLAAPKQNSDAVSLDYLQSNYVSKSDPDSGYLSTKGGTMSGNINMGGNSITNVKMPDAKELKSLDQSAAATVGYVMQMANTVTNNSEISDAVSKLSGISSKVSVIEAALGIPPSQENPPEEEVPEPEEPAPDTSLFVSISGSTMSGDLNMDNHAVKNVKTPLDTDLKDAANVEYVQSKISTPQIRFLGNTISTETTVTDHFEWKTSTPPPPPAPPPAAPASPVVNPDKSPTTPLPNVPKPVLPAPIRMEAAESGAAGGEGSPEQTQPDNVNSTPISDKYLKIEDSNAKTIKVLSSGILTLSVTATWSGDTSANISVILNPSPKTPEGTELISRTASSETVVYTVSALQSGQNMFFQIPVQEPSDLKLKLNSITNGTPPPEKTKMLKLSSWSWQTTLLPSIFPQKTNP
ncbi:Uncharacterised protein [Chlamydia abortus]|uniref:hypothetical protein n=1 Tax=Chlamydia abortus TaxID=83555 RepID=UPI000A27EF10|nr:hypothetical protein [Chlamydia abortus]SFW07978.1 Uncharacterised protein [Chlamydia abortus]SGA05989.1 Uncharacterised protein [Chlamydia abortus]SGA09371.1 Uncharacterised protein [Chlamydia abortus]SGA23444.1 Uncharacterised protein [Chlamydia abortus]SGA29603.1 Uncharacterised protein [Chlamydia abortus]